MTNNTFFNYNEYIYKKQLKKDLNLTGILLIIFFIASTAITTVIAVSMLIASGLDENSYNEFFSDTTSLLTMSGFVSLVVFFFIGLIYCLIRKVNLGDLFTFKKVSAKYVILLSVLGLSVCMVANYLTNILMLLFDFVGIDGTIDMDYSCDGIIDVLLNYIVIALLPAFVEEFAFRGIILGSLRKYSDSFAVIVSAVVFGLMHGNFMQIPFAFVVGLILGLVVVKTNSLIPSMAIHFLNNAMSVTFSVLQDLINISDDMINLCYTVLVLVLAVLGILSALILIKRKPDFFTLKMNDEILPFKTKIKLFCTSPAMIVFAVFSIIESISILITSASGTSV